MKLKQIVIATSLAMATGQALAIPVSPPTSNQIFIAGSSAQQASLGLVIEGLCQPGSIHVFYDGAIAPFGNKHRAYQCNTVALTGIAAGTSILVNDRAEGGSVYGVNPVADSLPIVRMAVDSTCFQAILPGVNLATVPPSNQWACPNLTAGTAVTDIPDAGVSDVEPNHDMFTSINLPNPPFPQPTKNLSILTINSEQAVGYGIAATLNVKPNLSRLQVTSLISGSYGSWDPIATSPPALTPALVNKPVVVCRRAVGSGSQAAMNAYFGGFPCLLGARVPPLDFGANPAPTGVPPFVNIPVNGTGTYIIENATTGAVVNCLNVAASGGVLNGGVVTDSHGTNFKFAAGGSAAALGILGLEKQPIPLVDQWRFETLDGITANTVNMMNGTYDFYVEQTIQWRNNLSPLKLAYLTAFKDKAGDPAIIQATNLEGVAALALNAVGVAPTLDAIGNVTNRVMKGSRLGNTCSPSQLYY